MDGECNNGLKAVIETLEAKCKPQFRDNELFEAVKLSVEQQPPKVVRVWNKRTGRESLAIPQMRGNKPEYYLLLLADGTMGGERVRCNNWEEVQS